MNKEEWQRKKMRERKKTRRMEKERKKMENKIGENQEYKGMGKGAKHALDPIHQERLTATLVSIYDTQLNQLEEEVLFADLLLDTHGEEITYDSSDELRNINRMVFDGDIETSLKRFQELLDRYPGNSVIYSLYAQALRESDKNEEALKILKSGLFEAKCISSVAKSLADYWFNKSIEETVKYYLLAGWCHRNTRPGTWSLWLHLSCIFASCSKHEQAELLQRVGDLLSQDNVGSIQVLTNEARNFLSKSSGIPRINNLLEILWRAIRPELVKYIESRESRKDFIIKCGRCARESKSSIIRCPLCGEIDRINVICTRCGNPAMLCSCNH